MLRGSVNTEHKKNYAENFTRSPLGFDFFTTFITCQSVTAIFKLTAYAAVLDKALKISECFLEKANFFFREWTRNLVQDDTLFIFQTLTYYVALRKRKFNTEKFWTFHRNDRLWGLLQDGRDLLNASCERFQNLICFSPVTPLLTELFHKDYRT